MPSCFIRFVACLAGLIPISEALTQEPAPQQRPPELAMERVTRERWMHGRQLPRFTPFATNTDWLLIDSIRAPAAGRALHLTLGRNAYGRDSATVVTDSRGRVRALTSAFPRFRAPDIRWPDDSAGYERMMRFRGEGRLRLAEFRLWDLILAIPPGSLRPGARWSDTLARSAVDGANTQQLAGT